MALIIVNTFPKSGTGLIRNMMSGIATNLGHLSQFDGAAAGGPERSKTEIFKILRSIKEKAWGIDGHSFMTAHLHHNFMIKDYMRDMDTRWIFLYRDLRGVAVSHAYYITKDSGHCYHEAYSKMPTMKERAGLSITGWGGNFPDIGQRFLPYIPWMFDQDVYSVKYENLVEDKERIILELGIFCSEPNYQRLLSNVSETNYTLRKGDPHSWKEEMSEDNKRLFDGVAGWTKELI